MKKNVHTIDMGVLVYFQRFNFGRSFGTPESQHLYCFPDIFSVRKSLLRTPLCTNTEYKNGRTYAEGISELL